MPGRWRDPGCAARSTGLRTGIVSDAHLELWPELRAAFFEPDEVPGVLRIDASSTLEQTQEQALALLRGG
jgi:hypothetical protein